MDKELKRYEEKFGEQFPLMLCRGCNVWNYLYDIKALQKWCKEYDKDFILFTMEMHRMLEEK